MTNFYKIILVNIAILTLCNINAQTIILKETVPDDYAAIDNNEGPNRKKYTLGYISYGFHTGGYDHNDSVLPKILGGRSFEITSGARFYRKLTKTLAFVTDTRLTYSQYVYNLKKNTSLQLPVSTTNLTKAKHYFGKYGVSAAFQINLNPKRGNQLGKYLHFGVYGNWLFSKRFVAKTDTPLSQYGKTNRLAIGSLKYTEKWEYGFEIGYGRTNMLLFARYRYSDYFNGITPLKELPRITLGLQVFTIN